MTALQTPNAAADQAATVRPEYKRTEVGVIPEDWVVATLGDFFEITSSKRVLQSDWKPYGVPFYRAREIAQLAAHGLVDGDLFITEEQFQAFRTKFGAPKARDVLITGVGTLGRLYIVRADDRFYFKDASVIWLRSHGTYSSEFLKQLFDTALVTKQILDSSTGTTVGTYTIGGATRTWIPAPPLPEQRAIAEVLSDADDLLGTLDALIAKKGAIKQASMQQLLTGSTRLPGFSGEWETKRIDDLAAIDTENLAEATDPEYAFNYVSLEQVDYGTLVGWSEEKFISAPSRARRALRTGDVLVATVRPNLRSHLLYKGVPERAVCSTGFAVLRCKANKAIPAFVCAHFFASPINGQIERILAGSNYPAINRSDVARLEIKCPDVPEQAAIATVLSDMDAEIAALEARRDKTRAIKQGMMQQLLTGRVRLVKPASSEAKA